jgi:hypothetical protein
MFGLFVYAQIALVVHTIALMAKIRPTYMVTLSMRICHWSIFFHFGDWLRTMDFFEDYIHT